MANWNVVYTYTTVGGTIHLNAASGDTYLNDPGSCSGLDGAPLRTPIDDAPQTDAGIVHDFYKAARHITLGGLLYVVSSGTESGFVTARNALEDALVAACDSNIRADATLQWTPTGGSSRTLTVRCDVTPTFSGSFQKNYLFGLVAADPAWV